MSPPHRKRIRHFDEPGHAHFLTFSCYHRLPLFTKDRTCNWFVETLRTAKMHHEFHLWAWVIMPEHVHLLIWPTQPNSIPDILKSIKIPVAKKAIGFLREAKSQFLEKLNYSTSKDPRYRFWQAGPGFDTNVVEPKQIHQIIDYIHHNPVRRGLVETPTKWTWSSASTWESKLSPAIEIDTHSLPMDLGD